MKKILGFSAIIVFVLAVLAFAGKNVQTAVAPQGHENNESPKKSNSLTVLENLYDFGEISMKNGNVEKIFTVTNTTSKDVTVSRVVTSCMCTNAYVESASGEKGPFGMEGMGRVLPISEIVKAGESLKVKVVYDPNAHGPAGVGIIDRFVYLTDTEGGTVQLEIKAVVTP